MNPKMLILSVMAFPLVSVISQASPSSGPPNILLIIADDMGFSDPGCYGGEIDTPHLDRLAGEGVRFTQFYNAGRCWPTRSNIMLGYYGPQTGSDPNRGHGNYVKWTRPLPQLLEEHGYRTYHSGKWHVPGTGCHSANAAGFDRAYDQAQGYLYYTPFYHALDGVMLPRPKAGDGYFMDRTITDYMLDFLKEHDEKHPDQPFFAYLSFLGPHYPLKAPARYVEKYDGVYDAGWDVIRQRRYARLMELGFPAYWKLSDPEAHVRSPHSPQDAAARKEQDAKLGFEDVYLYQPWASLSPERQREQAKKMEIHAGMVDLIDEQVGRILELLESQGKLDNTVVFFLSDNGADSTQLMPDVQMKEELKYRHDNTVRWGSEATSLALGPGWASASNTPFRRHKIWVHEGGISTPLIVRWPEGIHLEPGGFVRAKGHVIDFVPTFLELAGAPQERATPEAPPFPGKSLLPLFRGSDLSRDFLYFKHAGNRAYIKGDLKAVSAHLDNNEWELYDLSRDRTEMLNLRNEKMDTLRKLVREWAELDKLYKEQGGYPR